MHWDDLTVEPLCLQEVGKAREPEIEHVKQMQVCEIVPIHEAQEAGHVEFGGRWDAQVGSGWRSLRSVVQQSCVCWVGRAVSRRAPNSHRKKELAQNVCVCVSLCVCVWLCMSVCVCEFVCVCE